MQYLDDTSGDSLVMGTPEACASCGRDMLAWDTRFGRAPEGCAPTGYAMCWGPR